MSGTSLDGVDGVLVRFDAAGAPTILGHASVDFSTELRAELLALNQPSADELRRAALAGNQISLCYASVVRQLTEQAAGKESTALPIQAIGAHGQTVRHQPKGASHERYSLQLINPALLAEKTGLPVIADFRSRDLAAGGQGAPLVPAFHQAVFGQIDGQVCVLNIGGIANLSVLMSKQNDKLLGFDCGPGNILLDAWCQLHQGLAYDHRGQWATGGQVLPELLRRLLSEPYFALDAPKSTGRDLFNLDWLSAKSGPWAQSNAADVQATLAELTASTCAQAVSRWAPGCNRLLVCGGGALNTDLMNRLARLLPSVSVKTSDAHGLPAQQVEAAAFAWLARQSLMKQPGNVPSVTGAAGPRILGALYPA